MEHPNTNYLFHEGLEKDEENLNGAKAQMTLPAAEGPKEAGIGQDQPGAGAAAAESGGAEELIGECPSAAATAGLVDNWNLEDRGTSGSDKENEKQPKEPVPESMGDAGSVKPVPVMSSVQPVPVLVRERSFHYKFTRWQLRELERIFKQKHYISSETRKQLAIWIGVTEARVQNWFKGRREQYRSQQKL